MKPFSLLTLTVFAVTLTAEGCVNIRKTRRPTPPINSQVGETEQPVPPQIPNVEMVQQPLPPRVPQVNEIQ
jgi:hypothetical protein